jgi:hypothetical protein
LQVIIPMLSSLRMISIHPGKIHHDQSRKL